MQIGFPPKGGLIDRLFHAIENGDADTAQKLIEANADVHTKLRWSHADGSDYGATTAFYIAVKNNRLKIMELLRMHAQT